jgi:hypothetical protein
MSFHTAKSSMNQDASDETSPIRITFNFEITDDEELRSLTASDEDGRPYTVSIRLVRPEPLELCCCSQPDGTMKCLKLTQCNCEPV